MDWSFSQIWNDSLLSMPERPLVARDYIYASELGGSMIDRYYKMLGTKYTNPPNKRSLRKFQAGNIWEFIISFVLKRAGILKDQQTRAELQLPGCLRVSGKIDFIAGGAMDWELAKREVDRLGLPEIVHYACEQIIVNLQKKHGNHELVKSVLECKSVSSFVYERAKRTKVANPNHLLQVYHYLIGTEFSVGKLVYVCRDDCRLMEFDMYDSALDVRQKYEEDIRLISEYYGTRKVPPKEKELIFDEVSCRFNKNWKVEYSPYLTKVYKYKTPEDYRQQYAGVATSYNYTFKRCVNGDKMTVKNLDVIKEAKKKFPRWDDYVIKARETGVLELMPEEIDD